MQYYFFRWKKNYVVFTQTANVKFVKYYYNKFSFSYNIYIMLEFSIGYFKNILEFTITYNIVY